MGQLLEDDSSFQLIAPTWRGVYQTALGGNTDPPLPMHSQQPPGVVQNWSTLQCSKHDIEQCGYDHAPVTRGRMRTQFPLPHGPPLPRTGSTV